MMKSRADSAKKYLSIQLMGSSNFLSLPPSLIFLAVTLSVHCHPTPFAWSSHIASTTLLRKPGLITYKSPRTKSRTSSPQPDQPPSLPLSNPKSAPSHPSHTLHIPRSPSPLVVLRLQMSSPSVADPPRPWRTGSEAASVPCKK